MKKRMIGLFPLLSLLVMVNVEAKTYYEVLGINAKATAAAIGTACKSKKGDVQKRLSAANDQLDAAKKEAKEKKKELDPKKFKELNGAVRTIRTEQVLVTEACKILKNPEERKKYDRLKPAAQQEAVSQTTELQAKAQVDESGIALDSIEKKKAFIQKHIDRRGEFRLTAVIGDFFSDIGISGAPKTSLGGNVRAPSTLKVSRLKEPYS